MMTGLIFTVPQRGSYVSESSARQQLPTVTGIHRVRLTRRNYDQQTQTGSPVARRQMAVYSRDMQKRSRIPTGRDDAVAQADIIGGEDSAMVEVGPVDDEHLASSQPDRPDGKNPAAVELGRRGGKKGGKVRAARMSAEERSAAARRAAVARWSTRGEK